MNERIIRRRREEEAKSVGSGIETVSRKRSSAGVWKRKVSWQDHRLDQDHHHQKISHDVSNEMITGRLSEQKRLITAPSFLINYFFSSRFTCTREVRVTIRFMCLRQGYQTIFNWMCFSLWKTQVTLNLLPFLLIFHFLDGWVVQMKLPYFASSFSSPIPRFER